MEVSPNREPAADNRPGGPDSAVPEKGGAWDRVQLARGQQRPHALEYVGSVFEDFHELHGDRSFGDDPAIIAGFGVFRGRQTVIVGHEKGRDTKDKLRRNFGMPKPEGYRKALRVMKLAAKFGRPVVTLLDTPGAYPGIDAEERGQAEAIARSLYEMAGLGVPVIAVCIGEGGSGGALAMGVGNRVLMFENSIYSVISPESCAAIVWRDAGKAELAANALKLTAQDLLRLDLIDEVIPEPLDGAQADWDAAFQSLGDAIERHLVELERMSADELRNARYEKFRRIGSYFTE